MNLNLNFSIIDFFVSKKYYNLSVWKCSFLNYTKALVFPICEHLVLGVTMFYVSHATYCRFGLWWAAVTALHYICINKSNSEVNYIRVHIYVISLLVNQNSSNMCICILYIWDVCVHLDIRTALWPWCDANILQFLNITDAGASRIYKFNY